MSRTMQVSPANGTHPQGQGRVPWHNDLVAVGAAVVCALVLWGFTTLWGDVDLVVRNGERLIEVGGITVAVAAAVAGLLGMAALRLLERVTPRALTVWTVVAIAVTLVSAVGPLGATTASATGTLLGLHAVVAVVLIVSAHRNRSWAARPTR